MYWSALATQEHEMFRSGLAVQRSAVPVPVPHNPIWAYPPSFRSRSLPKPSNQPKKMLVRKMLIRRPPPLPPTTTYLLLTTTTSRCRFHRHCHRPCRRESFASFSLRGLRFWAYVLGCGSGPIY